VADLSGIDTPVHPARTRRISMKQDARKDSHRRKRQKRRLAMRKYMAEKKSKKEIKGAGSVKIED
jgi:hypothetical protein